MQAEQKERIRIRSFVIQYFYTAKDTRSRAEYAPGVCLDGGAIVI